MVYNSCGGWEAGLSDQMLFSVHSLLAKQRNIFKKCIQQSFRHHFMIQDTGLKQVYETGWTSGTCRVANKQGSERVKCSLHKAEEKRNVSLEHQMWRASKNHEALKEQCHCQCLSKVRHIALCVLVCSSTCACCYCPSMLSVQKVWCVLSVCRKFDVYRFQISGHYNDDKSVYFKPCLPQE